MKHLLILSLAILLTACGTDRFGSPCITSRTGCKSQTEWTVINDDARQRREQRDERKRQLAEQWRQEEAEKRARAARWAKENPEQARQAEHEMMRYLNTRNIYGCPGNMFPTKAGGCGYGYGIGAGYAR